MRVVLFSKEKPGFKEALKFLRQFTKDIFVFQGTLKDSFPMASYNLDPDIVVSYISPWIIPRQILLKVRICAINFHPGPPEYPGIGCTNFALYNGEKIYGVTVHIMEPKVDSGKIIGITRFPILENDDVYSLTQRCYLNILNLFCETIETIITSKQIPACGEKWKRKPYTRKDLDELCRITIDMDRKEVERRIKATSYPNMPGAYIDIYGHRFEYNAKRGREI